MASIQEALRVAVDHHGAGRLREAEILYGRILDAAPGAHAASHLLGMLLAQTGRLEDAAPRIAAAVRAQPDIADYHRDLGKVHQALGLPAEAMVSQRRATALQPDDATALALLGVAAQMIGDTDAAIGALGRALTLEPGDGETRQRLGLLLELRGIHHLEQGRVEAAVADLSRLIAVEPPTAERLKRLWRGSTCRTIARSASAASTRATQSPTVGKSAGTTDSCRSLPPGAARRSPEAVMTV